MTEKLSFGMGAAGRMLLALLVSLQNTLLTLLTLSLLIACLLADLKFHGPFVYIDGDHS